MPEEKPVTTSYDLILIGSGIGALTVASVMAQLRGKRVLILERHFEAGGFTHAFRRGRFCWDVGVHYIGDMKEGSRLNGLFRLITGGKSRWTRMPDPFDVFVYPDVRFEHRSPSERFIDDLSRMFPAERPAIRRYVRDVRRAATGYRMEIMARNASAVARGVSHVSGTIRPVRFSLTTKAYLDEHFRGPQLKAMLASQWGDYGLPPAMSPFPLHSLVVNHYLDGAYYPVGGAGTFADAVEKIVERPGGRILLGREVTRILIENGRAAGVRARNGRGEIEEFLAPVIVSDAGAALTYLSLISRDHPIAFRDSLAQFVERNPPTSHVSLYVGLSSDARRLGFRGENHWLFRNYDHDASYARRGEWVRDGDPETVFLSFPSLKDPEASGHTAELVAFADYEPFARWRAQLWRKRDVDYQALKERIADGLVRFVEQHYPGFADLIEYRELSTPITNEFMTGHRKGAIYGLHPVPERYRKENRCWSHPKTPIPGLYLTGADVASPGIGGAMMGSLTTLSHLPEGVSFPEASRAAAKAG